MSHADGKIIAPYEIIRSEGYTTLKLNGALLADSAKNFDAELQKFVEAPYNHVVVNCEHLSELSQQWVRSLVRLGQQLRTVNTKIRLIFVSPSVQTFLKVQGVNKLLPTAQTMRSALIEFGLATPRQLDVNFINPFLVSAYNTLKIQAHTEARAGQVYKSKAKERYLGDISGVIGLVSEAFIGAVVISFPEETFLKIMSRMLGETHTQMSKDIEDGAGELTNIIFAQAKVSLNEKGYGIRTAIPSVVTGKGHTFQNMTKGPKVVVPFETDAGPFYIEICLSE